MRRIATGPEAWHVVDRGSRRLELFRDDEDRLAFLKILRIALLFSGCVLWAYGLMSNHYHLVLYGSSWQLTRCMKRLKNWYSIYHNQRYGLNGAAFEGPYKAFVQKSPPLLARTLAYVVLNPWRAGLRAVQDSWLWTSIRAFTGGEADSPVPVDPLMAFLAIDPDAEVGLARYQEAFKAERARPDHPRGDVLTASEIQGRQFDWCLEIAGTRDLAAAEVPTEHAAAYWAAAAGVPLRVIARRMGLRRTNSIQEWIQRLEERMRTDTVLLRLLTPP